MVEAEPTGHYSPLTSVDICFTPRENNICQRDLRGVEFHRGALGRGRDEAERLNKPSDRCCFLGGISRSLRDSEPFGALYAPDPPS